MAPRKVTRKVIKPEEKQLRDYELVFIVNPQVADEKFESTVNNVSQFITDKGGTVDIVDKWGKKKLAYPIKRFSEGNYVLTKFKMRPALSKELETSLRISEDVLRHLLVTVE